MKFGKYFIKNQIKKWLFFYVDYNKLKIEIKNDGEKYDKLIDLELKKLNDFIELIKNYDESDENICKFLLFNYMALFKSIKKYDKRLCKNKKLDFFKKVKNEKFFKYYIKIPRRFNKTRLVIFDKDGTLVKHEEMFGDWLIKLTESMGYLIGNKKKFLDYLGFDLNTKTFNTGSIVAKGTNDDVRNGIYNYIVENNNFNKEKIKSEIKKRWIDLVLDEDKIIECGNIKKIFDFLTENNIYIAICTSDDRENTYRTINYLGIRKRINYITCGNDPISSKPSPEPIWKICSYLNVDVSDTIIVGDTIADIHSGINSKCGKIIGVLSGGYNGFDLEEADQILDNIDYIPDFLKNNDLI